MKEGERSSISHSGLTIRQFRFYGQALLTPPRELGHRGNGVPAAVLLQE